MCCWRVETLVRGCFSPASRQRARSSPRLSPSLLTGSLRFRFACFPSLLRDHYDCRLRQPARFGFPRWRFPPLFPTLRSQGPRETPPLRLDVGAPVSSFSGSFQGNGAVSPSFPGYPHMPLPCSRLPVRPPPTWPAPHCGGVLLCAWRCCPPLRKQEGPDEIKYFGIQSHGFGTRSIRFVRSLRSRYAMFASEWLPAFLGWECFTHWVSITCFIFLSLDSSCSGCWRDSLPSVRWFGLEFGCAALGVPWVNHRRRADDAP